MIYSLLYNHCTQ